MSKKRKNNEPKMKRSVVFAPGSFFDEVCRTGGDVTLDKVPEVVACARRIAELLGSATIHLMSNTDKVDERIINELSRVIDINPEPHMTRSTWVEAIIMTLLLYGGGNAIVMPHTSSGLLGSLEPIAASRVSFTPIGYRDYKVNIDGIPKNPSKLCHFVYNPDPVYLWRGRGIQASIKAVLDNLVQARKTESAFMASEYKPSLSVRVDAMVDEFSTPEGRDAIIDDYMKPARPGQPWLIPGEQFDVQQVKPLSLADLAINDSMTINKRMIAAIFGCPAFFVGVGDYNRNEFNTFLQTKIMSLSKAFTSELTKKLITSPKWYLQQNIWSLMDYDLRTVSDMLLAGSDRGFVNGDEWRDRMHMNPAGLTEYRVLENYIPWDMAGNQKKLIQEE